MIGANLSRPVPRFSLADAAKRIETEIGQSLCKTDEASLDPLWSDLRTQAADYALRPAKRLRPALCALGYQLATGMEPPDALWRFGAGLELVHTFMLVHDDVADRAELRRGGPALHRTLGAGRVGEDLAVVAGDHLFALGIETLLSTPLPRAAEATRWFLGVCRHTAAGQYLDLALSRAPLAEVTIFRTVKVAHLKTARYGFVAPLVCGALLGGASEELLAALERVGRHAGLAYQLVDDLMGLFGDPRVTGKPSDSDVVQGKRTFPLVAAWLRAPHEDRVRLEALLSEGGAKSDEEVDEVRQLVARHGGRAATLRTIARSTRAARRALALLPEGPAQITLDALVQQLAHRAA